MDTPTDSMAHARAARAAIDPKDRRAVLKRKMYKTAIREKGAASVSAAKAYFALESLDTGAAQIGAELKAFIKTLRDTADPSQWPNEVADLAAVDTEMESSGDTDAQRERNATYETRAEVLALIEDEGDEGELSVETDIVDADIPRPSVRPRPRRAKRSTPAKRASGITRRKPPSTPA